MRGLLVIAAVALSGCSLVLDFDGDLVDAAVVADAREGGAGDAGPGDAGDAAVDASVLGQTIQCGASRCVVGSQICCRTTTAATCQPKGSACSGWEMACDGSEDCPGDVCCGVLPAGPLLCLPYGIGTSRCSGKVEENRIVICNERTDCKVERPICQQCTLQGTPIKYCTDVLTAGCTAVP